MTKDEALRLVREFNSRKGYEPILGVDYHPQKFDLILAFNEKHGDRHFIVHTREELQKVALKIVLERNEEGWYEFNVKEPVKPDIELEKADSFSVGIANAIKSDWGHYRLSLENYKSNQKMKTLWDKVAKNNDSKAALELLEENKDGQYEGFEIITPESFT